MATPITGRPGTNKIANNYCAITWFPQRIWPYQITDDPDEAVKIITRFYRNYHSMRFVHELLVIRLKYPPSASAIAGLNEDFADIMNGENIPLDRTDQ